MALHDGWRLFIIQPYNDNVIGTDQITSQQQPGEVANTVLSSINKFPNSL